MNARKRQRRRMERAARAQHHAQATGVATEAAEPLEGTAGPETARGPAPTSAATAPPDAEGTMLDRVRRELRAALAEHSEHEALAPAVRLMTSGAKRPTPKAVADGLEALGGELARRGLKGPSALLQGTSEVLRALGEMAE